ncbi:hypothetical protein ACFWF7_11355 [Nocardia sp. NPDC060256]|uniref:hypothetical protein n=1 Tax=unclassified Nocardia TaxID=2637762 RepID=UPI003646DF88
MSKQHKSTRAVLAVAATAIAALTVLAPTGSADPAPSGTAIANRTVGKLLIVPLPGIYRDTFMDTPVNVQKIFKLEEAFCTTEEMDDITLDLLDTNYREALPVTFGTAADPEDPISEARDHVLNTKELTNASRLKLCKPEVRDEYYALLTELINAVEVMTPVPKVRDAKNDKNRQKEIDYISKLRVGAFRDDMSIWLDPSFAT